MSRRFARPLAALVTTLTLGLSLGVATTAPTATAATPPNGGDDVILNLFQWTWDSVAAECTSTIGPAGYGYVQVSPPQEHVQGSQWWTSYQPVSYRIESKLGTRAEFAAMVQTCRNAGVGVIADAVVNHMAAASSTSTGVAGSTFGPDSFPGIYGYNDFNDCRSNISNYGDRYQVQNCRLVSLQDLRTGSSYVQDRLAAYLNDLLSLGVAGFRIDAAKHIPAADLAAVKSRLSNPNVFWVHEVIGAHGEPVQPSEYLGSGDSHEFQYARDLKTHFDGQIRNLRYIGDNKLPSDRAQVFVDNHDTERNGETMTYAWGAKYTLANTFLLSWPYGSPTVYSGYRFSGNDTGAPGATSTTVPDASCSNSQWVCTQRWTEVRGMVGFHNAVAGTAVTNWWDDGNNHIAYGRGARGYVAINNTGSAVTRTYQTSLPAGTYCDVVASTTCSVTRTVNASGQLTASVPAYGSIALHVGALSGSTPPPAEQGDVSFGVNATTVWGQNVYVVGNLAQLGSWNPAAGVAMSSAAYPVWRAVVDLPAGTTFQYKYVKRDGSGNVVWESGANRVATVGANGALTLNDTWRP
ncbi:carbohydrate-binding module family 20 domain-containing protein [Antribacter gilvus]|uniref:carbohydrate-binding module family 20 domain-containing protein n=1 Tax=Antribacter gilvus TaxID=2304675 RepID=UPI000F76D76C|nr:carbohydrate-binding module family 20 domain-containing protein [Antribacter gilvus]